jgi:hypothetical protein
MKEVAKPASLVAFTGPDGPAGCNCGEVDVVVSLDRLKSQTLSLWSWPVTQAHHVHQADMEGQGESTPDGICGGGDCCHQVYHCIIETNELREFVKGGRSDA